MVKKRSFSGERSSSVSGLVEVIEGKVKLCFTNSFDYFRISEQGIDKMPVWLEKHDGERALILWRTIIFCFGVAQVTKATQGGQLQRIRQGNFNWPYIQKYVLIWALPEQWFYPFFAHIRALCGMYFLPEMREKKLKQRLELLFKTNEDKMEMNRALTNLEMFFRVAKEKQPEANHLTMWLAMNISFKNNSAFHY